MSNAPGLLSDRIGRLALSGWLEGLQPPRFHGLAPPGLRPDAVLVVRRIALGCRPDEVTTATAAEVAASAHTAARPAPGRVAPADAILFEDAAELLACYLLSLLQIPTVPDWVWTHLRAQLPPPTPIAVAHDPATPLAAVLALVDDWTGLDSLTRRLARAGRLQVVESLAARHRLWLRHPEPRPASESDGPQPPEQTPDPVTPAALPPAGNGALVYGRIGSDDTLGVLQIEQGFTSSLRQLVGRLLGIPTGIEARQSWRTPSNARPGHREPGLPSTLHRVAQQPTPGQAAAPPTHPAPVAQDQAVPYAKRPMVSGPEGATGDPSPRSGVSADPDPAPRAEDMAVDAGETSVRPPAGEAGATLGPGSTDPAAGSPHQAAARPTPGTPPGRDRAGGWPSPFAGGDGVPTGLGGVLYLVNCYRRLDLERHRLVDAEGWEVVEVLGRLALAREALLDEADPLWGVLAKLAGRPIDEPPAATLLKACGPVLDEVVESLELTAQEPPLGHLLLVPGRLHAALTTIELVAPLDAVDLVTRRCALDSDPGWVPRLGRIIRFRFVEEVTS